MKTIARAVILLFLVGTNLLIGQTHHGDERGVIDFPISGSRASQEEFTRAMILLHHMTYPQAREAFQKLTEHDSTCAMAYWGVAMTLFQPLWPTRPGPADLERGWEAIQKAKSLNPPTRREQLLIAATEAFFRDPKSTDYWKRIHAWADGMKTCFAAFFEDHEVAAFYALTLLATVPPDHISSPNNARAAEILLSILKKNPDHPGAMHYLIHANDVPSRERESLETLRAYEAIAPNNPHALHMPTHIYTRLGNWREVIRGNTKAAAAALEFPAGDKGQYIWDEYPHSIEYMVYAYLQLGADDSAYAQWKRLKETPRLEPTFKTAFHLASIQARYVLERKAWNEAASLIVRESDQVDWDRFPWPEAISWFARGLGNVHTGNLGEAERSLTRLEGLDSATTNSKEVLFARNIRVLRLGLSAWIADLKGSSDSSIALMTEAAELEVSTPKHSVTPAATLPAYELLGDLLLKQGKQAEAGKAYKRSLEINPRRFNSLLGAARTSGEADKAVFYQQLLDLTEARSQREGLREARSYLKR